MKKLLALLLLSPLAFAEPSKNTQDYLWNQKVSILSFGLYLCDKELADEVKEKRERKMYLRTTGNRCLYNYEQDQIILRARVMDIENLFKSWVDDEVLDKLLDTGEISLDLVQDGCQKVSNDLFALDMALSRYSYLNPHINFFANKGIADGGFSHEEIEKHVADMFKIGIRLSFNEADKDGYTCEASAKDKKYGLGDDINFSVRKESDEDYVNRL